MWVDFASAFKACFVLTDCRALVPLQSALATPMQFAQVIIQVKSAPRACWASASSYQKRVFCR